ncbi:hypothetical protein RRF57_003053 [Xylaria bambusicola]|uniref:Uncharacterized protein n=1 Tax=Xylaria bambusicola TaxID=326684 RepID=A0AAN7Z4Z5_9PEZI
MTKALWYFAHRARAIHEPAVFESGVFKATHRTWLSHTPQLKGFVACVIFTGAPRSKESHHVTPLPDFFHCQSSRTIKKQLERFIPE